MSVRQWAVNFGTIQWMAPRASNYASAGIMSVVEIPIFTNKTAFVAILVLMCCFPAVMLICSMGLASALNTQLVLSLRYSQPYI